MKHIETAIAKRLELAAEGKKGSDFVKLPEGYSLFLVKARAMTNSFRKERGFNFAETVLVVAKSGQEALDLVKKRYLKEKGKSVLSELRFVKAQDVTWQLEDPVGTVYSELYNALKIMKALDLRKKPGFSMVYDHSVSSLVGTPDKVLIPLMEKYMLDHKSKAVQVHRHGP